MPIDNKVNEFMRPPLGITPRWIEASKRICVITNAIHRFLEHYEPTTIPEWWIDELKDRIKEYNDGIKNGGNNAT